MLCYIDFSGLDLSRADLTGQGSKMVAHFKDDTTAVVQYRLAVSRLEHPE